MSDTGATVLGLPVRASATMAPDAIALARIGAERGASFLSPGAERGLDRVLAGALAALEGPASAPVGGAIADPALGSGARAGAGTLAGGGSVLVWHPGSPYATGDVARGLVRGLRACGVRVIEYQQAGRFAEAKRYLEALVGRRRKAGVTIGDPTFADVARQASIGVLEVAARTDPAWVIVVNGGFQDPTFYVYLRRFGFKVALLGTEAPYQIAAELHLGRHVDHVFVIERRSLPVYAAAGISASYLPAAWDPGVHRPAAALEASALEGVPAHDVVFVGSAFVERIAWLEAIDWTGIDLGLYGDFGMLSRRSPLRRFFKGRRLTLPIRNARSAALYARAAIGINLHRTSNDLRPDAPRVVGAESANPRAYELPACGVAVVTDYRAEVAELYGGYGVCATPADMGATIRHLLTHPDQRRALALAQRAAVADHSWATRARTVLALLGSLVVVASVGVSAGCVVLAPWPRVCADGAPVKVLTDAGCHRGVCGWTCAPGRWVAHVPGGAR